MIQQWQMADFKLDSRPRSTLASFHSKKPKRKEKLERASVLLYVLQQDRRASELSSKHMMLEERCDSLLFFLLIHVESTSRKTISQTADHLSK